MNKDKRSKTIQYGVILLCLFSFSNCSAKYTNEVLVKCVDTMECEKVLAPYNFKKNSKLTNEIHLIQLDSTKDAKDVAKTLEENEEIEYAHPNYIRSKKRR